MAGHSQLRERLGVGRFAVVAVSAIALAGGATAMAGSAAAGGLLPTTTTVSASPSSSIVGTPVTLTATVSILGVLPGLLVTPTGPVSFTAVKGSTTTALGSASLGTCLLTTCTARLTTSAMPAGTSSVRAAYAGDFVSAASQGAAAVTVAFPPPPPPDPGASTTQNCTANNPCSTTTVTSSDGETKLQVTASASSGSQSVSGSLTSGQLLNCPGDTDAVSGGALATFTNSASDAYKTITYTVRGPDAVIMHNNYASHSTYEGCFASPNPFQGYTNGLYGPAQQVTDAYGNTYYEAQLRQCVNGGNSLISGNPSQLPPPCIGSGSIDGSGLPSSPTDQRYYTLVIYTQAGDPKFVG